jgi:multidrug resistance efflux pump
MPKSSNDIPLRSAEVEEILTKVPHWMIRWGNLLFVGLLVVLLFISWMIKYPDIIVASATITTQTPSHKEYAKITGQLDTMLVLNHQSVKAGQPLAIIESTARYEDVYLLKSILNGIHLNNKSIHFPIDSALFFELGEIESAYAVFENDYLQYSINRDLQPSSNEAIANNYSILELKTRLETMRHQKKLSQLELSFKKKDLERNEALFDEGVISERDLEGEKLNFSQAERDFEGMRIAISQVQESMKQAEKISRTIEIGRIENELTLLRKVIQSFNQLKERIKEWELSYVLKSEINGSVLFLNHWYEHQMINKGDLVFTIMPMGNTTFVAKLKTPSQNFGKIEVGQTVSINLESYPEGEYGVLKGRIENISAISDKEGLYLLDASLSKSLTTSYQKELEFKQEMRGTGEIITSDLRLIDRFFQRLKKNLKN